MFSRSKLMVVRAQQQFREAEIACSLENLYPAFTEVRSIDNGEHSRAVNLNSPLTEEENLDGESVYEEGSEYDPDEESDDGGSSDLSMNGEDEINSLENLEDVLPSCDVSMNGEDEINSIENLEDVVPSAEKLQSKTEVGEMKKKKVFPPKEKKSRKRVSNPSEWKNKKSAAARSKGEKYISQSGKVMPAKTVAEGNLCHCTMKCSEKFDFETRILILKGFYKLDINAKNTLFFKSIVIQPVARMRKCAKKHRSASFRYDVGVNKKETRVCKKAFCALFKISYKKVDIIQSKLKQGGSVPTPDKRGHHNNRPHKLKNEVTDYIVEHIKMFPSEESHYSRHNNPHKRYLSPVLTLPKMFQLYNELCTKDKKPSSFSVKLASYRKIFNTQFNLSFGNPKSDTCSTCDSGGANNEHRENYVAAFEQQRVDRQKAQDNENVCYLTMDLQQTMPLPRLTTSKAFYLRQMWFYNFGVHSITSAGNKSFMMTWTEDLANRGSSEIASCLHTVFQIEEAFRAKIDHLIIWSDSCAGQNKNFNIICLYQYMILKGWFKIIDHKFPEVGHSYLDSDRDFGRIEKVLRKTEKVSIPEQYRNIIRSASARNTVVMDMEHHFRKIEDLPQHLHLINRKKNVLNYKVNFRDNIKWIRVEEFGTYFYKESFDQHTPFLMVDIKKNGSRQILPEEVNLARIVGKTGSLSEEKIANLRQQIGFIDEEYRYFYEQFMVEEAPNKKSEKKKNKKQKKA